MARLEARDGRWFELAPVSYQFPGHRDRWDANWLNVSFEGKLGLQIPRRVDSALLTWEIAWLASWCRAAAAGTVLGDDRRFQCTEPNFELRFGGRTNGQCTIEVRVCHGFAPNEGYVFEPWVCELEVSHESLAAFADQLEREAAAFPVIDIPE